MQPMNCSFCSFKELPTSSTTISKQQSTHESSKYYTERTIVPVVLIIGIAKMHLQIGKQHYNDLSALQKKKGSLHPIKQRNIGAYRRHPNQSLPSIQPKRSAYKKEVACSSPVPFKLTKKQLKAKQQAATIARNCLRDNKNAYRDHFFSPEIENAPTRCFSASYVQEQLESHQIDLRAFGKFDRTLFKAKEISKYLLKNPDNKYENEHFNYTKLAHLAKKEFVKIEKFNQWVKDLYDDDCLIREIVDSLELYNVDLRSFARLDDLFNEQTFAIEELDKNQFDYSRLPTIYRAHFKTKEIFTLWLEVYENKRYSDIETDSEDESYSDIETDSEDESYSDTDINARPFQKLIDNVFKKLQDRSDKNS